MKKYTPDPENQPELLKEERAEYQLTPEEQKEKEIYRKRLRAYLRDPEFRQIEGFPIGEDENILALSDPPFYTACPNPFLGEIIEKWQQERGEIRKELDLPDDSQDNGNGLKVYHREPFASDVSEGKNNPIYTAHSYHTKVPHKAVMRYILHYTDPGDIVLDGFCGTGMTGVAAQLCGDKQTVESLGYSVQRNSTVHNDNGEASSKLGVRKAVLADLSPVATFIANNYNTPVEAYAFEKEAHRILKEVENECSWMYETWHPHWDDQNRTKGKINYTIWSDVFMCPNCNAEMVLWDIAVDIKNRKVKDAWECPGCNTRLAKSPKKDSGALRVERAINTSFDRNLGYVIKQSKRVPVIIDYSVDKQRLRKRPDQEDLLLIQQLEESNLSKSYPVDPMMFKGEKWGDTWRAGVHSGITHVHHFYTLRNLYVLSEVIELLRNNKPLYRYLLFWVNSILIRASRMSRVAMSNYLHGGGGPVMTATSGTLYVPSFSVENSVIKLLFDRLKSFKRALATTTSFSQYTIGTTTQSAENLYYVNSNSVDYIFVDPPFGSNLMYSELNFISESWHRIYTENKSDAVINKRQQKGFNDYQTTMEACFREFHRIIKPGRWMTVEFHNSQNVVWNAIQEAIMRAGFVIADVRTLDKKQGSFKQVTTTGAVKQDLVISAYKPRGAFERQFLAEGGSLQGAWAFIRQHLEQLPIPSVINGMVETLAERQNYLLYDRMLAFHIMRGLAVPLSAAEFYQGLNQRFLERDGMYFTPVQVMEYDKRRLGAQQVEQLALFVSDEKTALQWLRRELEPATGVGPQTYQDLQPKFLRELHQARHEALPELSKMLEDNFLQDEDGRWYAPNPEKQADLEALRQRSLLREFNEYLNSKGRLKIFRSEAVRAGFSHYWKERDYDTIMKVADRLPPKVLEEDQQLLMYVHNAGLRQADQPKQTSML